MFLFFRVLLVGFLFCGTQLLATVLYVQDAEFIPRYSGNTSVYNPVLAKFTSQVTVKEVYSNSAKDQFQMLNNGFQDIKLITWNIAPSTINSEIQFGLSLISDDVFKNFARSSVQAYSAWKTIQYNGKSRRVILIAFRGTEGFSDEGQIDWVVNLNAKEVNFNPQSQAIKVHKGFFESVGAFEEITGQAKIGTETLAQVLQNGKNSDDIFLIAGHSLGGALATIFAAKLIDPYYYGIKKDNLLVYTYGAPAVGNADFKYIFFNEEANPSNERLATKLNLHRIRDVLDIVPYAAYITEFAKASQETKVFKYLDMSYLQKVAMAATIIKDDYTNEWPFQHIGYLRQYNNGAYEQNGDKLTPLLIPGLIAELAAGTPRHFIYTWAVDDNLAKAYQPKYAPRLNMSPNDETQVYPNPKTFYLSSSDGTSSIHCDGLLNDMYGSGTITLYQTTSLSCYAMTATGETSPFIEKTIHISNANNAVDTDGNDLLSIINLDGNDQVTFDGKKLTVKKDATLIASFKNFTCNIAQNNGANVKFWVQYDGDTDKTPILAASSDNLEFTLQTPKEGTFGTPWITYEEPYGITTRQVSCGAPEKIEYTITSIGGGTTTGDTTASLPVLHTGQTISYAVGDDAYYHAGKARSYTRDNTNNIVTDNITGLMWQDDEAVVSVTKNWGDAQTYCADLRIGQYSDWRLPNINELFTLISQDNSPAVNSIFKYIPYRSWSINRDYIDGAWVLFSPTGQVETIYINNQDNIRCVRNK